MDIRFKKIGLAVAFSPRLPALLAEASRMKILWNAELVLIHVGNHGPNEEKLLAENLENAGLYKDNAVSIFWEKGLPEHRILERCKKEHVDLLIAGALKKENLLKYYLGTIARKILRRAHCSVLMLITPSTEPKPYENIVVNAEDSPYVSHALAAACYLGVKDNAAWLHVVREIKMYGLTMPASEQRSETEYDNLRQRLVDEEIKTVEKMLSGIPHEGLKVNIKLVSGKSGFELSKFAQKKHADLLVVGAPPRRFSLFDRLFPHDLEYIFADMPCNLLIMNPGKEVKGG